MRLSAALYSPHHPWLACLKSAQLQRIARATGIQSSGTKGILVERIATELTLQSQLQSQSWSQSQSQLPARGDSAVDRVAVYGTSGTTLAQDRQDDPGSLSTGINARSRKSISEHKSKSANPPWSILSFDMGIQNLAFAHLLVPRSESKGIDAPPALELTAWHRLAVSEISTLNLSGSDDNGIFKPVVTDPFKGTIPESEPEPEPEKDQPAKSPKNEKEKPSFSPDLYAANAYTLISSLLSAYRPTHVLIERQRFRSGGGSAVQEWTLRVGVLEGMLYAVLHTLRHERGDVADVVVRGVEPRRVVRYWLEGAQEKEDAGEKAEEKGKRLTARDVKKAKIDLVGRWISAAMQHADGSKGLEPGVDSANKIVLADKTGCPVVHGVADAYLRKWQGRTLKKIKGKGSRASKTSSSSGVSSGSAVNDEVIPVDPGKLDDLADCLLQGVTWVEWQVMRDRLARAGVAALDSIP
jgi:cruciform cutting endonuclease 1